MFSSSAEVLCYLEPGVTRFWSVLTALHSVSGFITLELANAFLNVCFVVLFCFLLLCSLVLEAFSACFWHWTKWMWNLCCVKTVAAAVFWYNLRA